MPFEDAAAAPARLAPSWPPYASAAFALLVVAASVAWTRVADRILLRVAGDEVGARPAWGLPHVGLVASAFVLGSLGIGLAGEMAGIDRESTLGILLLSAAMQGFAVLVAVVLAVELGRDGLRSLGVSGGRGTLVSVLAGLFVYASFLPAFGALGYLWQALLEWSGRTDLEQELVARFASLPASERLWPVFLGVAVVPLFEEVLFRAFLQPVLVARTSLVAGIAITSTVFAILHGAVAFVPIFALSCVLGLVYARTRRLHVVWAIHAAHNGLQFALLFTFPELVRS